MTYLYNFSSQDEDDLLNKDVYAFSRARVLWPMGFHYCTKRKVGVVSSKLRFKGKAWDFASSHYLAKVYACDKVTTGFYGCT